MEKLKKKKVHWESLLLHFTEEISLVREEASGMSLGKKVKSSFFLDFKQTSTWEFKRQGTELEQEKKICPRMAECAIVVEFGGIPELLLPLSLVLLLAYNITEIVNIFFLY